MAILSQFSSSNWIITLNRELNNSEGILQLSDIAITNNPVLSIAGNGFTRTIRLSTAETNLNPNDIVIDPRFVGPPLLEVIATDNADLIPYLSQIRDLIGVSYKEEDIPDNIIKQDIYLRQAEFLVYEKVNEEIRKNSGINTLYRGLSQLDDATYDAQQSNLIFIEKHRIAVMYRTAALMIPALPQILQDFILRNEYRYAEIDWQEKILEYENKADEVLGIEPETLEEAGLRAPIEATVIANSIDRSSRSPLSGPG